MIKYLSLHPKQNHSILVDKNAFENAVSLLPKTVSGIKVNNAKTNIVFLNQENNAIISIEIRVDEKVNLKEKIKEIKNELELSCLLLIDTKPKNIIINCLGTY